MRLATNRRRQVSALRYGSPEPQATAPARRPPPFSSDGGRPQANDSAGIFAVWRQPWRMPRPRHLRSVSAVPARPARPTDFDPVTAPNGQVRVSRRFSNELVEDARQLFQKRTDRQLTSEDARQMLENLVGFFTVLNDWDRRGGRADADEGDA